MRQVADPKVLRFRCHEGHAYTAGSLFAAQTEQNRSGLREMVSAMREQRALGERVAEQAEARGDAQFAQFVRGTVTRLEQRAERLLHVLHESEGDGDGDLETG